MTRVRVSMLAAVVLVPLTTGAFLIERHSTRDSARLFDQVLSLVSDRFVDTVPSADLYEKAARGLVREINDPYAALYSPKQLAEFTASTGGRYAGLGMLVEDQQGVTVVSRVYPHTPAEAGGVHDGDHIVAVESQAVHGWKLPQVTDALKGSPGTQVNVTFARPGVTAPIALKLTRAMIHIPAVPYTILLDGKIGYLPLLQFNETSGDEFEHAVQTLTREGARGIVIDLRGNGGGIVDQAIDISNLFLKDGAEIATVRARSGEVQRYAARGTPRRADAAAGRAHRRLHRLGERDRRRRAAGSRPRARRRHDVVRQGARAVALHARWWLGAQAHHGQSGLRRAAARFRRSARWWTGSSSRSRIRSRRTP